MKLPFGLEIRRRKQLDMIGVDGIDPSRGWIPLVREPFTTAWQHNREYVVDVPTRNATVFRCISIIADDIAKLPIRLTRDNGGDFWFETESAAFSPVLRQPNDYQTTIQFFQHWLYSKLTTGNAYVLKQRDARNIVTQLYVLDPYRTKPMVAGDGSIWYQLSRDYLSGIEDSTLAPSSEIIHDRMNAFYHPLCGLPPIYASRLQAMSALQIQEFTAAFFGNMARPSGIITSPGNIPQPQIERIKAEWTAKFQGENSGNIAILGSGMTFTPANQNAVDSQLVEQLKIDAEQICTAFGVPSYKVGAAPAPTGINNVEALDQQYYSQCLQIHIVSIERLLDLGLALPPDIDIEFDLDALLRMDTATMIKALADGINGSILAPNDARAKLGLPPVKGGEIPLAQQQYYSLADLANRAPPAGLPAPDPIGPSGDGSSGDATDQAAAMKGAFNVAIAEFRRSLAGF